MRNRAYRRHQTNRHLQRRLHEDRNQHYTDLSCACWHDLRAIARFKEQPKTCQHAVCGNLRRNWRALRGSRKDSLTIQERRSFASEHAGLG